MSWAREVENRDGDSVFDLHSKHAHSHSRSSNGHRRRRKGVWAASHRCPPVEIDGSGGLFELSGVPPMNGSPPPFCLNVERVLHADLPFTIAFKAHGKLFDCVGVETRPVVVNIGFVL